MTERDVRAGLRAAVADEPPLAFDPDALVTAARRETRRRRALVSASLATVAVAAAAVAVPVALGISRGQGGVGPGDRPTVSSSVTGGPPSGPLSSDPPAPATTVAPPEYSAAELRRRGEQMRAVLATGLRAAVPGAHDVLIQPFGGEAAGEISDGQDYLTTFVTYTLDGRRYGVGVNVFAPGAHPHDADELCEKDQVDCRWLDSSERLLAVTEDNVPGDPALRMVHVYDLRPDGSVVSVVGYNYDPTGAKLPKDAVSVPVTPEQLAKLAGNPALGL